PEARAQYEREVAEWDGSAMSERERRLVHACRQWCMANIDGDAERIKETAGQVWARTSEYNEEERSRLPPPPTDLGWVYWRDAPSRGMVGARRLPWHPHLRIRLGVRGGDVYAVG